MKTDKRIPVSLACEVCGSRNYRTTRRKASGASELQLKKFCAMCNRHTTHRETK